MSLGNLVVGAGCVLGGVWSALRGCGQWAKGERAAGTVYVLGGISLIVCGGGVIYAYLKSDTSPYCVTEPDNCPIEELHHQLTSTANSNITAVFKVFNETIGITCKNFIEGSTNIFGHDCHGLISRFSDLQQPVSWGMKNHEDPFIVAKFVCQPAPGTEPRGEIFTIFQRTFENDPELRIKSFQLDSPACHIDCFNPHVYPIEYLKNLGHFFNRTLLG